MKNLGRNTTRPMVDARLGFDDQVLGARDNPLVEVDVAAIVARWDASSARARRANYSCTGPQRLNKLNCNTALLVVDMQVGFDDPAWGARNNPAAEANVAALITAWRAACAPVIHIHHDSPSPAGFLRQGTPGNAAKPQARPLKSERVYRKSVNSAFIGTSLEADLRKLGIEALAIVGLTTNHCISTSARMAGNLGFETFVLADATATFDRASLDGRLRLADDVHNAALSDLQGEFAEIVDTVSVLEALARHDEGAATQSASTSRWGTHG